jgi:hypothetical protein
MKNEEIDYLEEHLGKAFLSKSDESVVLHQGVAAMLLLRSQIHCSVEINYFKSFGLLRLTCHQILEYSISNTLPA